MRLDVKNGASSAASSSSLDFKADAKKKHSTTPGVRPKGKKRTEQQHHQQEVRQGPFATRSRGSSGLPPPYKYELSDLEGLSEEELMQVLYNDPQLASEVKEAASKQQEKMGSGRSSRKSKSKSSRRKPSEYPAHVQERMEEGVPVFQWVILLLLLGAGFFQLYKLLTLPPPGSKSNKGNKQAPTKKNSKQQKASKNKGKPAGAPKNNGNQKTKGASKIWQQ